MVWDDYYGKQNNPYDDDDFRLILKALESCEDKDTPEVKQLIVCTYGALITELGDDEMVDLTFRQLDGQTGWSDTSKVKLLIEFIENNGLTEEARRFLCARAEEEDEDEEVPEPDEDVDKEWDGKEGADDFR